MSEERKSHYFDEIQGLIHKQVELLIDYGCYDDIEEVQIEYGKNIESAVFKIIEETKKDLVRLYRKIKSDVLKIIEELKNDLTRLKKDFREQELIEEQEQSEEASEEEGYIDITFDGATEQFPCDGTTISYTYHDASLGDASVTMKKK